MRKLLIPARLSSYLSIMEAVEWVAYRRYPIEISQEDADYYGDSYKRYSPTFNIKRVLPPAEKTEVDKEIDAFIEDQVERGLFNDKFDYARQNELNTKKKEEDALAEAEYQSKIEIAKYDLFVSLKKGVLNAYGDIWGRMMIQSHWSTAIALFMVAAGTIY